MNAKAEKKQLQQQQQQQLLETLSLASTKDILIRSAGGCFPVQEENISIVSDALLRCVGEVVLDAVKFSTLRPFSDEVSFEDVLLAIRKDSRILSRVISKLEMLDGRDAVSLQTTTGTKSRQQQQQLGSQSSSSSRFQRAFAILGSLHPEAFVLSASASGLVYGRLLRSAAAADAHHDDGESACSGTKRAALNFGNDMKTPAIKMWLSTLTGGLPLSEAALELISFCLFEFLQQIVDIATLQAIGTQRPQLSKSSTLCYLGQPGNILPEATRRFLENRRAIRRT